MKAFALILSACLFGLSVSAQTSSFFEKEDAQIQTFKAKVRVVRDISEDVEVFFESEEARGAYTLPRQTPGYSEAFKALENSKKRDGPVVEITADKESKIIKSVKKMESKSPAAKDKDVDKLLNQFFQ